MHLVIALSEDREGTVSIHQLALKGQTVPARPDQTTFEVTENRFTKHDIQNSADNLNNINGLYPKPMHPAPATTEPTNLWNFC